LLRQKAFKNDLKIIKFTPISVYLTCLVAQVFCVFFPISGCFTGLLPSFCFNMTVDAPISSRPALVPGTLYLVATPIGNLEDMTLRALRTLKECDIIAAEDTRHTGHLLKYFEISKPLISYFQFNEAKRGEEILARLGRGEKVALVTDAGTPGISDPGERVVKAAIKAGYRVEAVPGPCALVTALTASGLSSDEFHFVGFLPHKSGQRRNQLEKLKTMDGTLIFYESPYRVLKMLTEISEVFPERQVVLARELTKKFEEFLRGTPSELLTQMEKRAIKGEFVVLIGPAEDFSHTKARRHEGGEEE
jgi:16S rRNA (cytidine1402-2'-O)-methyltransferase